MKKIFYLAIFIILASCSNNTIKTYDFINLRETSEIYNHIIQSLENEGYTIQFIDSINDTALDELNRGRLDIDLSRMAGLEQHYKNIIQTNNYMFEVQGIMYMRNDFDFDNAKMNEYKFGAVLGHIWATNYVYQYSNHVLYSDMELAFSSLNNGTIDIFVNLEAHDVNNLDYVTNDYDFEEVMIESSNMLIYSYVHKKHRELIPIIDTAIEEYRRR